MNTNNHIQFEYDDGGRAASGFKGKANDCVCRAIAIVTGKPYKQVYNMLNMFCRTLKTRKRNSSSRTGIHRKAYEEYLFSYGFKWIPTMGIGTGCRVHLRPDELPKGKIIVSLSKHVAAVIDGVLHDTYDCSREGTRCVYGYYTKIGK